MPKCLVFAGPNGSGKSTVTQRVPITGVYVNADDIKRAKGHTDAEAALEAEEICHRLIETGRDFTFETVLSSPYKLRLLRQAKERGYSIQAIFITTKDPEINVRRVEKRVYAGGHAVPPDKIRSRYDKSMKNIPALVLIADRTLVFDNSGEAPELLCEKDARGLTIYGSSHWTADEVRSLFPE